MKFSKRMDGLSSAIFSQLEERKNRLLAEGREVVNFSIGTPDLPPAPHIIDAMREGTARPENHRYAVNDLPELQDSVINWYKNRFGVELEKDEISSIMGSQEGLSHLPLIMADPGDTVLVPDPCYPVFGIGPHIACASIYRMPMYREKDFIIDLDSIPPSVAHSARLMTVSYPNNPVTAVAPDDFYEKLVWFARKYEIVVLHDNAYCELVFDGKKCGSFLSFKGAKEIGVEFNSLSKSYNMPGCRISFAMGNREVIGQLKVLKSHLDYGVFIPVQMAAVAALTGPQDSVVRTVETYRRRRDMLVEGLAGIGWLIEKPPATMFVWAPIPRKYKNSLEFTLELLEKTGVIVVPGSSFGGMGEGYVRLALVQPEEKILKAIELIAKSDVL